MKRKYDSVFTSPLLSKSVLTGGALLCYPNTLALGHPLSVAHQLCDGEYIGEGEGEPLKDFADFCVSLEWMDKKIRRGCSKLKLARLSPLLEERIRSAGHSPSLPLPFASLELLRAFERALLVSHHLPLAEPVTASTLVSMLRVAHLWEMSPKIYRWVASHLPKTPLQLDDALEIDAMEFPPAAAPHEALIKAHCQALLRTRFNGWLTEADAHRIARFSAPYLHRTLRIVRDHNDKFWLVMVWLAADEALRRPALGPLLDEIDFHMLDKHFMADMVSNFARKHEEVMQRWVQCLAAPKGLPVDPLGVYAFHLVLDLQGANCFDVMRKGYRYRIEVKEEGKGVKCRIGIGSDFEVEEFVLPVQMKMSLIDVKGEKVNKEVKVVRRNVGREDGEVVVVFEYEGCYESLKYIQVIVDVLHNLVEVRESEAPQ